MNILAISLAASAGALFTTAASAAPIVESPPVHSGGFFYRYANRFAPA
jgi:hypothetical protein